MDPDGDGEITLAEFEVRTAACVRACERHRDPWDSGSTAGKGRAFLF